MLRSSVNTTTLLIMRMIFNGIILIMLWGCSEPSELEKIQQQIAELQRSHIDGNVPDNAQFDDFLVRDLSAFFQSMGDMITVDYKLLRDEPTQVGVSYPKYYLWVRVYSHGQLVEQGAARVAAVEKIRFEILPFVSQAQIQTDPSEIEQIFPESLLNTIYRLADQQG